MSSDAAHSNTDSDDIVSGDLKAVCNNYATYITEISRQLGSEDVRDNAFASELHRCLVLVDELHTLLELVRVDHKASRTILSTIKAKQQEFDELFRRIDNLDDYIEENKRRISSLETAVSKAERELKS